MSALKIRRPTGRTSKAATLVPLALLSAAWTASIAGVEPTAIAADTHASDLPDGSTVPGQAIEAPASVPIPGAIAPSVPDGSADAVVAGASTSGISSVALAAYQRGAQIINAADTSCNIPWELLAAIGRVESNHGTYGANTLDDDGVAQPGIFGAQLNGRNGTQMIADTDSGQVDGDPIYDRAVGPMQFIPSTWSSVRVDADGDGQRNPQDIDDAALGSAVYLCSGTDNLSTRAGQEAATFRYNHNREYVDLVLRIMEAYSQGDYTSIPSGTYGGTIFSPSYSSAISDRYTKAKQRKQGSTDTSTETTDETVTPPDTGGEDASPGDTGGDSSAKPDPVKSGAEQLSKALDDTLGTVGEAVGGVTQPVIETLGLKQAKVLCAETLGPLATSPVVGPLLTKIVGTCGDELAGKTEAQADNAVTGILNGILKDLLGALAPKV